MYIDGCLIAVNNNAAAKFVFKDKVPTRLIACGAFANNIRVKTVLIPEGIQEIPSATFYKCPELQIVYIPNSLKRVEMYAFYECGKLHTAKLTQNVIRIGAGAFYGCVNLKEQIISDSIKTIEKASFFTCRSIRKITLPKNIEVMFNEKNESVPKVLKLLKTEHLQDVLN